MVTIVENDLNNMLHYFLKNTYQSKDEDAFAAEALEKCKNLLEVDYNVLLLPNENGDLTVGYPSQLLILENELPHTGGRQMRRTGTIYESRYNQNHLGTLIGSARIARCRARFPVPVILYKGKNICRSSTLACRAEVYGRGSLSYLNGRYTTDCSGNIKTPPIDENNSVNPKEGDLFDTVRNQDIELLKKFNVNTIVDLMVEKRKVKYYYITVTSSEKVDTENRYADFDIISFPYPGCEFFKDFCDSNRSAEGLMYDWNQPHIDATIAIPTKRYFDINWTDYKNWDLIELTQNYISYLLKHLQESTSGILIHCISGWDRTPLFISLLRLSLWADGVIHQGLNEYEILYLTITYDWMLFSHDLKDRVSKREEIFFFCFYMLKYLHGDDFSVVRHKSKKQHEEKTEKPPVDKNVNTGVNRADSDSQLELLLEETLRGSDISLNSICSSVSTKSQEHQQSANLHDLTVNTSDESNGNAAVNPGSPWMPPKGTSPVSVPANLVRQRHDSTSSISTGSWQVVTGTGSLRTCDNASQYLAEEEDPLRFSDCLNTNRQRRLSKVRELFYRVYYNTTAVPYNEGVFSTIIGKISEKVGF